MGVPTPLVIASSGTVSCLGPSFFYELALSISNSGPLVIPRLSFPPQQAPGDFTVGMQACIQTSIRTDKPLSPFLPSLFLGFLS